MHIDQNIGAVKRNESWFGPFLKQGQQEDRDMTEIDVEQLRVDVCEHALQYAGFTR